MLIDHGHRNVVVKDCGLFIDTKFQFLGASPDGLVTCDCCGPALIEIKCPTLCLPNLQYLDQQKNLKSNTTYYGQVQGQMMVTELENTWFFVFYPDNESHLQLVNFDSSFCKEMRKNLAQFYHIYMAPRLLRGDASFKR
jgi:hypothetical protein